MFKVRLNKHYSTWYWYVENPQGGGFGSNYCGSKAVVMKSALRGLAAGAKYTLTVNDKPQGTFTKGENHAN